MPWPGVSLVDLRFELVHAYQSGLWSMWELCDQFGVSRKTAYKWVARYAAAGVVGLTDRSRRPHTQPRATDPAAVARLLEARRQHSTWGAHKLLRVLRVREPDRAWPSRSASCDLLARHGLVRRRPHARRVRVPVALRRGRIALALRAFAVIEFAAHHPGVAQTQVGDLLGVSSQGAPVDIER